MSRKIVWSNSESLGPDHTKEQALLMAVRFLWNKPKKAGGKMTCKPTQEQIVHALQTARKILAGVEADESDEEGGLPSGWHFG